jgi:hypothetical protein
MTGPVRNFPEGHPLSEWGGASLEFSEFEKLLSGV